MKRYIRSENWIGREGSGRFFLFPILEGFVDLTSVVEMNAEAAKIWGILEVPSSISEIQKKFETAVKEARSDCSKEHEIQECVNRFVGLRALKILKNLE